MYFQPMHFLASILTATTLLFVPLTAEPIPAISLNPAHLSARSLEKRHDCHGSTFCGSAGKQQIGNAVTAMNKWLDDPGRVFNAYASRTKKSSDNYGMTSIFFCNSDEDYKNSKWTGQDIFNGMNKVYTGAYCGWCGSFWLDAYIDGGVLSGGGATAATEPTKPGRPKKSQCHWEWKPEQ
ncbi:MAG: hypothetical protein Q9212_003105 [Teloschistes hypoglaucus]